MSDVFVSYTKDDRMLAEYVVGALKEVGYSVWWDAALVAGTGFGVAIQRELDAAQMAIVIWSPISVGSHWVNEEAGYARERDKLLTTRTADLVDLPLGYRGLHTVPVEDRAEILRTLQQRGVSPSGGGGARPGPAGQPEISHDPRIPTLVVDPWPGSGGHTTIAAAIAAAPEGARLLIRPGD